MAGSDGGVRRRGVAAGSAWHASGSGIRVWHRDGTGFGLGGRHFSVAPKFCGTEAIGGSEPLDKAPMSS